MKRGLDMDKIAKGLGAERRGKVSATGGYFGALQLLADVEARFRVPPGGGRATDPRWTERRLVPLTPQTLTRLEELAAKLREQSPVPIEPMQLAGLLLEKTTEQVSEGEAARLLRPTAARVSMPDSVQCGHCGAFLSETGDQTDRLPCPHCGSNMRTMNVSVLDELEFKEQLGMKAIDPTQTGKRKVRIEQLVGDDLHRKSGKWHKKVRVIDRGNNRYLETITDPETGDVIRHCEEPLTDHQERGSAKPRQSNA
jgi:hypothetical protein